MARLPRLAVAGESHYVILRGLGTPPLFADASDRAAFLAALREAAAGTLQVHAYALGDAEVALLVTPAEAGALGRTMQALGRRYVASYNRRHGRSGPLWAGRFRAAPVEAGRDRLDVLRLVDGTPAPLTSAAGRLGAARDALRVDPPEFWSLGNTPFEREAAYRALQGEPLAPERVAALRRAALGGWPIGSPAYLQRLAAATDRPLRPRPRGRPKRVAAPAAT